MKLFKLLFCLVYFAVSFSCYLAKADGKVLKIELGKVKKVDLGEAPRSVEVTNPEVIDVERVGLSNVIQIFARTPGRTSLIVRYPRGTESSYEVSVGGGGSNDSFGSGGLLRLAHDVQKISGLEAVIEEGKVYISGSISRMDIFRQLTKIVGPRSEMATATYQMAPGIQHDALLSVQEDISFLGENKVALFQRNGMFILSGVLSSQESKKRTLSYVKALLPNVIDGTDSQTGFSDVIQVNLQFLEVGRSGQTEIGFKHPGSNEAVKGTLNFASESIKSAVSTPFFQISSMSSTFKALKQNNSARELASPVIITRSGERASFLAGGEIPLSMVTEKGPHIEFKPYGISLAVVPKSQSDGSIWLALDLEFSSVQNDVVVNGNPGFLSKRMNTNVILQAGQVALLSGLVRANDAKSVEKFPILGSIPIVGELFKSRKFIEAESELWIAVAAQTADSKKDEKINLQKKFEEKKQDTQGALLD